MKSQPMCVAAAILRTKRTRKEITLAKDATPSSKQKWKKVKLKIANDEPEALALATMHLSLSQSPTMSTVSNRRAERVFC